MSSGYDLELLHPSTQETLSGSREWQSLRHSQLLSKDKYLRPVWVHCLRSLTFLRTPKVSFLPFRPLPPTNPMPGTVQVLLLARLSLDKSPRIYPC